MNQEYLEHIDEHIDASYLDSVPILGTQEKYDEWIEALAKHELNVIIEDQEDPDLELSFTVEEPLQWVEESGTIQSFDYADNYYAIKGRAREIPDWLANDVSKWKRDPNSQMTLVAESLVARDVANELRQLIDEYDSEVNDG